MTPDQIITLAAKDRVVNLLGPITQTVPVDIWEVLVANERDNIENYPDIVEQTLINYGVKLPHD